ncbi:protein pangolin, isoforms A/H/I/S-like isoform X2 [Tachypleus tridentatus]|uniref:protein pangolin, isoforms A/H/I/S-like isoform X2 n=2 Tax=Tachypleus tridentatus TaxID=6853 RepID=UPI003FD0E2C0
MPHVGGGCDDLASFDEIKVFKDEGEEENHSSENLTDLKSSLVTEGEEDMVFPFFYRKKMANYWRLIISQAPKSVTHPVFRNLSTLQRFLVGNVHIVSSTHPSSPLPFMMYNRDSFTQPPPAHMGISPLHIDPKTVASLSPRIPRTPIYPIPGPRQYPHPVFSSDFTQQFQWHTPSVYSMTSAGFRGPYSTSIQVSSASIPRFSPPSLLPPYPGLHTHPGFHHPALLSSGPKHGVPLSPGEDSRHFPNYLSDQKAKFNESSGPSSHSSMSLQQEAENKKNYVKKPLNAFMLYMKEMRDKVVAECTLKESAAINQILGKRWHNLAREEQSKYYEMARKERQLHMQLYPGWSARENYALNKKKKKKNNNKSTDGANNPKKCRARFGLNQQNRWCKPCRRKKKCIRYLDGTDLRDSEDNIGSVSSIEAPTPDTKCATESDQDGLNIYSELSLSSSSVLSEIDVKPEPSKNRINSGLENAVSLCPTNSSQNSNHLLSIKHLTAPYLKIKNTSQGETTNISVSRIPSPDSTDSSTPVSTAAPPMLIVQ